MFSLHRQADPSAIPGFIQIVWNRNGGRHLRKQGFCLFTQVLLKPTQLKCVNHALTRHYLMQTLCLTSYTTHCNLAVPKAPVAHFRLNMSKYMWINMTLRWLKFGITGQSRSWMCSITSLGGKPEKDYLVWMNQHKHHYCSKMWSTVYFLFIVSLWSS